MKRFVWRLQRVLDVKGKEEQLKQAELLKLSGQLAYRRNAILIEKSKLDEIIEELNRQAGGQRLDRQQFFLQHSKVTDELITRLGIEIEALKKARQEKIEEIIKIRRYKDGLEKLREDAKKEFIYEQEKLEQKDRDEVSTIRFVRKVMAGNKEK